MKKAFKAVNTSAKPTAYHVPVLAEEAVKWWMTTPDGNYIDGTFGGGGHSRLLLERLGPTGRLLAFDRDADAVARNPIEDARLTLIHHNYAFAANYARFLEMTPIHGVLLDLGVSSHQLDTPDRGFSFHGEGPLDMRMDQDQPLTAADVLNRYSEEDLAEVFRRWGEVPRAEQLARAVVEARRRTPWRTTAQLAAMADRFRPRNKKPGRFLAQVFQALRVEVNREIENLQRFLETTAPLLAPGGRMVLITFQGEEDRTVKAFIRSQTARTLGIRLVTKNVIRPAWDERRLNPRARSARMRVLERRINPQQ